MDDEVKQLLAELNDNIRNLSARTVGNVKDLQDYDKAVQGATRATTGLTEAEIARIEAQKKLKESEMYLKDANQKAKDAVFSFGGALLDNTVKLSNFGKGIGTAGDAAMSLGNAFGGVAKILGMVTKGATMLLEAQLKVTESYLNAKNQLNQLGGAGTHTTDSIREMARSADLNAETLGRMIKPLQGMGSSIMGLGSTAGQAQKNFAELMKATSEERMMMQRLGIDQEAMMQGTADYLQLQASSGRALKNELQDKEKLRRASIDYQTQLLDLAALTGKDVKSLKEQQKEQMMNRQMQLRNMQDQLKANRLREAGDEKGALALEKEIKTRNDSMQALAGSPKALQDGIRELMTTGAITGENAQALSMLGMQDAVQEYQKTVREGGDATEAAQKLQAEYVKKFGDRVESSGRQMAMNENIQNRYGKMTQEELAWMGNRMGLSKEEAAQNARDQKANREASMQAGKDGAADLQATAQEGVIAATGAMEDVIMKMPILGTAAIAAAAALGTIVLAARGAGGLGGLLGKGAKAAGPIASTVATGAGGAGAAAGGLGKMLGTGARALGKVAAPLAIGMSAYDAYKGFTADKDASLGDKLSNAGSSALHGLSFGLLGSSPEEIAAKKKQQEASKAASASAGGVPDKDAVQKMQEFSKLDIDTAKVKKNAEAFAVFSQAMSQYQPFDTTALEQLNTPGVADLPVAQMQKFAAVDLGEAGVKAVKNNAEAFTAFSNAMASYKGTGNQGMWATITEGVAGFFQVQPPYAGMENFAKINLGDGGVKKVKDNAQAFVYFGQALSQYKGGAELKNAADNIVGGIVKMFGGDDVTEKFVKFTKLDVDPDKALKLGQAFAAYTSALGMARSGGGGAAGAGGGGAAGAGGGAGGAAAPASGGGGAGGGATTASGGGGGILSRIGSALGIGGGDKGGGGKDTSGGGTTTLAKGGGGGKGGSMSEKDIKDMIIKHEGIRYEPYKDSLGLWTVGVGHLIGDGRSLPPEYNRKFSHEEVMAMFDKDYDKHRKQAESNVPGFSKFDSMGQGALTDLTFNMGPGWPKKFPNTSKKLAAGDTEGAAAGLTDSLWYQQVKSRGPTIVDMVRNSKVSARDGGLATGPETGYPATLHGNEMIVPLDPNSLLAELGKKSATEISTQIEQKTSQIQGMDPEVFKELANINQAMMDMMSSKLDAVINSLESSNTTQSKILKYSKA
jgi:GH24 family phage-related lysozyme (muramidase)